MTSSSVPASSEKPYREPHERKNGPWNDYELSDGAHHLRRAGEIIKNKKFLAAIKKHAETKAEEHQEIAHKAGLLAKMGRISPRAMAKLEAR